MILKEAIEIQQQIFQYIIEHHKLFQNSIPLIASENILSPAVKEVLMSDLGHRYAEGWPGERIYAGCEFIDKIELLTIDLMKKLYDAEFVDVRPISGLTANLAVYTAFTEPGDIMLSLSVAKGGHISMGKKIFGGTAGAVRGLEVDYLEFDYEEYNIDVDATIKKIRNMEKEGRIPKLVMFGGSVFLFPHPIKELADFLKSYDIIVGYDAAHVAGLIAGGYFQDPIREGADVMTMSTHKTFFGPQRGTIISYNRFADKIKKAVFPGVTSNHHLNTLAGLAIATIEMLVFGKRYAENVIKSAKALAQALYMRGFEVVGEKKGFTESHQVVIDVSKLGLGFKVERKLEQAGIIVNRNLLPTDPQRGLHYENPGGIRLGVQEVVRLGMGPSEMDYIAELFKKVLINNKPPSEVRKEIMEFRRDYQDIHYTFPTKIKAYEYIKVRDY